MSKLNPCWALSAMMTAGVLGGCVLPLPHVKTTCGPVEGNIIDDETSDAVDHAEIHIAYPDGGTRETCSDSQGRFGFPAKYRFHWGVVLGVALNYSLPNDCGWHDFTYVTIKADGYQPVMIWPMYPRKDHQLTQLLESDETQLGFRLIILLPDDASGDFSSMEGKAWQYSEIPLVPIE